MLDLRSRSDIQKYHRWYNNQMVKLERKYIKEIKKVLEDQWKDAADYFRQGIGLESINDAVDFNYRDMLQAYTNLYTGTSTVFHEKTKSNVKSFSKFSTKKQDEGAYWAKLNQWMHRNLGNQVKSVQKGTKRMMKLAIMQGINKGLSNNEIADDILDYMKITEKWRAMRIVRTEVHSAAVKATDETFKTFDLIAVREWSAAMDERTRDAHMEADGQEVNENEPFIVDDEKLMFPGDPNGSPGNIINCRCVVLYHTARTA